MSRPELKRYTQLQTLKLNLGKMDLRIAAIEAISEVGEEVREPLLEAFIQADDRPRIRIKIAETFADHDWPVKGYRPRMEQALPQGFHITAKGLIRRR